MIGDYDFLDSPAVKKITVVVVIGAWLFIVSALVYYMAVSAEPQDFKHIRDIVAHLTRAFIKRSL